MVSNATEAELIFIRKLIDETNVKMSDLLDKGLTPEIITETANVLLREKYLNASDDFLTFGLTSVGRKVLSAELLKKRTRYTSTLTWPDKITLAWLFNNAPISLWSWFIGILLAVFVVGTQVGQSRLYQDFVGIFSVGNQESKDIQEAPNTGLKIDAQKSRAP